MTQQKVDIIQGMGRAIMTWAGILGIIVSLTLSWDQIGRNKVETAALHKEVEANSAYVIEDKAVRMQVQRDLSEVKQDVKTLLRR